MQTLPDPRQFPLRDDAAVSAGSPWHAWAEASLSAATGQEREAADARLRAGIGEALRERRLPAIEAILDGAPNPASYRHLWRTLAAAWRTIGEGADAQVLAHGFVLPVVVIAATDTAVELPAILGDVGAIVALLRQHGALAGNRNFGIANVLAGADALGFDQLPRWLAWHDAPGHAAALHDVAPRPIVAAAGQEGAHLRFLVGSALAAPTAELFGEMAPGGWGMPLAKELSRQLAVPGVQLLALPRPPADPLSGLQQGRFAHREIALQLFASNAIRKLRADFGEPTAVISAHRTAAGGEIRLSLSSPFGERDAEGFRCPLHPFDRVDDVLVMVADLLRACRVNDVRVLAAVHPDRDLRTGLPLLFRADALGAAESASLH